MKELWRKSGTPGGCLNNSACIKYARISCGLTRINSFSFHFPLVLSSSVSFLFLFLLQLWSSIKSILQHITFLLLTLRSHTNWGVIVFKLRLVTAYSQESNMVIKQVVGIRVDFVSKSEKAKVTTKTRTQHRGGSELQPCYRRPVPPITQLTEFKKSIHTHPSST